MVNISNFGTQALYEFLSVGTVNINYATTICGDPVNFPLDVSVTQNGGGGCIVCLTDNESDELTIPTVYNTAFGQPLTVDGLGFYDQQDLQFELYDLSGRSVYSGTLQGDIHIDQIQLPSSMYILRVVNISNKDLVLTQKLLVF
ncbi:T9SS type A sorting domain-containing protein [Lewinella sp. LCG006]|uniref:T9SS type A sorting domain-containing protein n=1 Tax=Lewinella sp. LCG006 TaxID=3231911 RepID=UPI0034608B99